MRQKPLAYRTRGQGLTEYGLLAAIVAVLGLAGLLMLGENVNQFFAAMIPERKPVVVAALGPSAPVGGAGTPSSPSGGEPSSSSIPGGAARPIAAGAPGTITLTMANGQSITLEGAPVDVPGSIATMGANGTTELLASQLKALTQKLLEAGAIDQAQVGQLNALANQGYKFADIEATLLKQAEQYGNDYGGYNFSRIQYDGESYSNPDALASMIGYGSAYGSNGNVIAENVPGGELVKFQNLLKDAQRAPIMKDPAVSTLVNGLSRQIMDIGSSVEDVINPNNYPTSFEQAKANIATGYGQTASNSGTICTTGGGTNQGISCN